MSARIFVLSFVGGETVRLTRGSTFLVRSASTNITVRAVNVRDATGQTRGDNLEFTGVGTGFKLKPLSGGRFFEGIDVYSAAANTVEIIVGDDEVEISGNVTATIAAASAFTAVNVTVGVAAASVATLNTGRKKLTVQALSTNGAAVYIGPTSGVTTGTGLELQPGAAVELVNTAAVWAISTLAAQSVRVVEET